MLERGPNASAGRQSRGMDRRRRDDRPPHRVRERRQPAAGTRHQPTSRDRPASRARCQSRPPHRTATHRKSRPRRVRRGRRCRGGPVGWCDPASAVPARSGSRRRHARCTNAGVRRRGGAGGRAPHGGRAGTARRSHGARPDAQGGRSRGDVSAVTHEDGAPRTPGRPVGGPARWRRAIRPQPA